MTTTNRARFSRIAPKEGYLTAPVLVALADYLLYRLQLVLASYTGSFQVWAYDIGFILLVTLVTMVAGSGPGLLALTLSALSLVLVLFPGHAPSYVLVPNEVVELALLIVAGIIIILLQDAHQKAQDHMHRQLEQQRTAAEREAMISRIGLAIRSFLDPEAIQTVATSTIATELGVDRCFFVTYDQQRDQAEITTDWYRPGLSSLTGHYQLSTFNIDLAEQYQLGQASVIDDVRASATVAQAAAALEALGLRSRIFVPLFDQGVLLSALAVAMAEGPRKWTPDEVQLVEMVAIMTRSAMEVAHMHQREQRIASRLQGAMQPGLPNHVAGLDLSWYYKACLQEANIGGDFADIFPTEKGCYALVVGDLSGKGLPAAAQVATLRNMLRYALYTEHSLAIGIAELNTILVEYALLDGFATLVVVLYDINAHTLTYVSCGNEPALLRRRSQGAVEELPHTGPILGITRDAVYTEHTVELAAGDVFALFTDGLTEAGPNHRELLGVAGIRTLLEEDGADAKAIATNIITGAKQFTGGPFADDVCLIVAMVEAANGLPVELA